MPDRYLAALLVIGAIVPLAVLFFRWWIVDEDYIAQLQAEGWEVWYRKGSYTLAFHSVPVTQHRSENAAWRYAKDIL